MNQDKGYKNITALSASISSRLEEVEKGRLGLSELDDLLADIRELEERIIVIRYKAIERLKSSEQEKKEPKKIQEPNLFMQEILGEDIEEVKEEEALIEEGDVKEELPEEEIDKSQISLIDSIEEISREGSVNEQMMTKGEKKSLAQTLQNKPIASVSKALNINQKMGIMKQVFKGDESLFKETLTQIDAAASHDNALEILNKILPEEEKDDNQVLNDFLQIVERRFL